MIDPNSGRAMQPGGIYVPHPAKSFAPTIDDGLTDAAVADEITELDVEVEEELVVEPEPEPEPAPVVEEPEAPEEPAAEDAE